jgi:O-glycosyl hydrolase
MVSAYKNADGTWVVVAINYSEQEQPFSFAVGDKQSRQWQPYRTSDVEGETLKPINACDGVTTLTPRSVTTFVEKTKI